MLNKRVVWDRLFVMANNYRQRAFEQLPQAIVFDTVVRLNSFSAAASELGLARSTVSQRISDLEQTLGVRLLHRTTRSMSLTEAGQKLLDEMAPILPCWRPALAEVQAYSTNPVGQLVVTAPDLLMSSVVVPAAKRYRAQYPNVQLELRATTTTLSLLDEGIDVALRAGPLPSSGQGSVLWSRGAHVAVATPSLAEEYPSDRPSDLADAPWIALKGRRAMDRWTDTEGTTVPFRVSSTLVTDSLLVFKDLLLHGLGFGILPEVLTKNYLQSGQLVRVLDDWVADEVTFHIVTASARRLNATVKLFVEELRTRRAEDLDSHDPRA